MVISNPITWSVGTVLDELHTVKALIEAVEAQLEVEDNNPPLRVLRVAYDRLAATIEGLDELSLTLPDDVKIDPEVMAAKRYVESDGKSH